MPTTIKEKFAMSFKTITELLQDRKAVSEEELNYLMSFSQNELAALNNRSIFNVDIGSRIRILYYLNKFKMADFKPHLEKAMDFDVCILIVGEKLTTTNLKSIMSARMSAMDPAGTVPADNLHIFELAEVLINITKHVLVPKHEIISDETAINDIITQYNLRSRHQLPLILKTDPIARYFGMRPGQLAKITRVSPSAAEYISYRCCV
jgi:DNA-directed RNA polymerase subunit H (RpoH/RPB5)